MKNKNFGFTLIELLVVIVIIGILATISTATFSGYFKKTRDTERQSFIRNAQQIITAEVVSQDTPDYRLGGTAEGTVDSAVDSALSDQGYSVPATKNGVKYFFATNSNGAAAYDTAAADFFVFACKEDALGTAAASITAADTVVFSAGTVTPGVAATTEGSMTDAQWAAMCADTPTDPTAANLGATWDIADLSS